MLRRSLPQPRRFEQRHRSDAPGRPVLTFGMSQSASPDAHLVPGRSCDGCTECCKLMLVTELAKPAGVWCQHCDIGAGCRIYDARPDDCRTFYCGWRLDATMGEAWLPARSRMVVKFEPNRILIHVDRDRKDAWRREPFNSQIRAWAAAAIPRGGDVIVTDGRDALRVMPVGEQKLQRG